MCRAMRMISSEVVVVVVLLTRTCGFVLRWYSGIGGLPNTYLGGLGMNKVRSTQ